MAGNQTRTDWRGRLAWLAVVCCWAAVAAAQPVLVVEEAGINGNYEARIRVDSIRRALRRAGLEHDLTTADRLATRALGHHKLVVLAAHQATQPGQEEWLRRFIDQGGKLLVCAPTCTPLASLVGGAEVSRPTLTSDQQLRELVCDQTALASLPPMWRQLDWAWQVVTPQPAAQVLGRWRSDDSKLDQAPAVVMNDSGALIGAALNGDDRPGEARLLLALATRLVPTLWHQVLPRLIDESGEVGDINKLQDLFKLCARAPLPPTRRLAALRAAQRAVDKVNQARRLYTVAAREATQIADPPPTTTPLDRYLPVASLIWEARTEVEQAYYLAQPGRRGEFRGVWLQQLAHLKAYGWPKILAALKEHHIDALFVNVVNGGYANYPSRVVPQLPGDSPDALAEVLAQCRQAGIQCHVWMMCTYVRPYTPREQTAKLRAEGRLQQDASGQTLPWLRPGDERNRQQMVDLAREIAERYDIDGLHLDYIRYAPAGDYSPAEREAFESTSLGRPLANWPADVGVGQSARTQWARYRANNVNRIVEEISTAVRQVRPRVKLSAAVYPIWVDAKYLVGQDPETWAKQGWVDFLCPMNYQTDDTTFYRFLTVQQRAAGTAVPLYPGIAAWRHETPADTISQIRRLRQLGMPGYVMFHLDRRLLNEWLPALSAGVTTEDTEAVTTN